MNEYKAPAMRNRSGQFIKGVISPNKFGVYRNCEMCKKEFYLQRFRIKDIRRGRFCSAKCRVNWMSGQRVSPKTEFKLGVFKGKLHPHWKGDEVGYDALHRWVYRNWGSPNKCEVCEEDDIRFEWANITGIYNRDRRNWAMSCVSCNREDDFYYPKRPNL